MFSPRAMSDRVLNTKAPSSTYRHCRISYAERVRDVYWLMEWLLIAALPSKRASSDAVCTVTTPMPWFFHSISRVSANADMRNKNSTGAILSPSRTPTPCSISSTSFSILRTTTRSVYILSIADTNLGGAPYFSRMLRRSS